MSKKLTTVAVSLALLCAAASSVSASSFLWTGGQAAEAWTHGNNWTPGTGNNTTGPGAGNEAQFGTTAASPLLITAQSIGEIHFLSTVTVGYTLAGGGSLTIGGIGGVGILNDGTPTEVISLGLTLGASQTWNAAAGQLGFSGTSVTLGANTLTIDGAFNTAIANVISGTGGLTKQGSGTLNLSSADTYSGTTTVNAGAVSLGVAQTLTGPVILGGGAFTVNNTGANSFGALTVNSASTLNLPASGSTTFASADSPTGATLTINGWNGDPQSSGTGAKIFLTGGATANFLNNVNFTGGYPQGGELIAGNELVPVPEPQVYAAVFALGLIGFALARRRMLAAA